ncbi:MAG: TRAP transporter large permease [Planctomycetota bacterium]|nr:TRAP transporter large permease [Planctomycetota bacterium]
MLTNPNAVFILLGVFFVLVAMGVHIAYSVLLASIVTSIHVGLPAATVIQNLVKGINIYSLMAVPFFILAGEIMMQGGITDRLIRLSQALVGWIRGSLAQVNIVACLLFGAISGSSAAGTSAIGGMMIPRMKKDGYDADFAASVTMASSVECMLIPPSHNMVLFALAAGNVSVAKLFLGGIVPGVLLAAVLGLYSYYASCKRNYPKGDAFRMRLALACARESLPGLAAVLIVVGGVIGGFFTATEAAAVSVFYALFVGMFVYREIKFRDLYGIFAKALKTISIVLILTGSSACFSWLIAYLNVPAYVSRTMLSITANRVVILLLINLLLIFCGMIMDMAALILITTPILLPIVKDLNMDPIQFCQLLIINLGMGLITPPVGGTLFIGSAISGIGVEKLTRSMLPFYCIMSTALLLVTFVPELSLFLPNLLMGN